MTKETKGKSPYARKGKKAFVYSDAYRRWAKAVADTGLYSPETEEADAAFRRQFDIPLRRRGDYAAA